MKVLKSFVWLFTLTALFACSSNEDEPENKNVNGGGSNPETTTAIDAGGRYTVQTVTVNRDGMKTGTATLRFYEGMDGVPYIAAADFYQLMLPNATMKVSRQGDYYELTTTTGSAMVDVKNDKLTSSTILSVFDLTSLVGSAVPGASYDSSPYVKPKDVVRTPQSANVTFDFKKYEIDVHDDGSTVYFPYATLADIYSDMNFNITYYNSADKELIVCSPKMNGDPDQIDPKRKERVYTCENVGEAMAKYRYNELCFMFDYIYGYPGHDNELTRMGMEQTGLDAALDKCKGGATVKKLLKEKDNIAFCIGMNALQMLAYDRGHTDLSQMYDMMALPQVENRYAAYVMANPDVATAVELGDEYAETMNALIRYNTKLLQMRTANYGKNKYIVSTDKSTAVIMLDSFMELDLEGWNDYYASPKSTNDWNKLLARDGNLMATFLSGVAQARKDKVKNVILDVTRNVGGSSDMAVAMLSLITRNAAERETVCLYSDCVQTKQRATNNYVVDRNFDGQFDAEDAKVSYSDLNFAVLTSNLSFSCGNLFPSMLKDSGFKVMGIRSGGGSCAVQNQFTPDGIKYRISCHRLRLTNKNKQNIDKGVPVDIEVSEDRFYDIDYLSEKFPK